MKDLKKLTRMQGEYFVIAFLFVMVTGVFVLYGVQYGDTLTQVHDNIMEYGFMQMHFWLCASLLVVLIVRTFFASGRENMEFLKTLPVKKGSWHIFDTVAGVVFILAVHVAIFLIYFGMMRLDGTQLVSLGKLFLYSIGASIAEYHVFLIVGYLLRKVWDSFVKKYMKYIEAGEERRWIEHTKQATKK